MSVVVPYADWRDAPIETVPAREPPWNGDVERAVIGAVLMNNAAWHAIGPVLAPEHFVEEIHRRVWDVASSMIRDGRVASPLTLKTYLGDDDLGGVRTHAYLATLARDATTVINAPDYARMLVQLAVRRALLSICNEVSGVAFDCPVNFAATSIIDMAETSLMALRLGLAGGSGKTITAAQAADDVLAQVDSIMAGNSPGAGATTGIPALDLDTGGVMPGDLWVVAGRVAMGKTIVGISLALAAAQKGHGVLLFPFEIGPRQATARALASLSYRGGHGIGYGAIGKGRIDGDERERLGAAARDFAEMPLTIDAASGATLAQISGRIRSVRDIMARRGQKLDLVVLDYLKFIKASDRYAGQRHYEVGEITVGLKQMAKDFEVGIVLLAQVNRQTESRDDKRPTLADLRESGDIESDTDVVMFAYRDIYYIEQTKKWKDGDPEVQTRANDVRNELELIVGKNRTGVTRTHKVFVDPGSNKIAAQHRGDGL